MKNKPKRSRSHDPRPRGRLRKGIRHLLRLAGFALILCVLLALFHLLTIGIPAPLTRKITAALQKNGIPLQVDSISLSTHRGWVLHNVRLFSETPDDLKPLFQADRIYLHIWPEDWTPISRTEWRLIVNCKKAAVSLGLPWETELDAAHPFRTVNRLHAHLRVKPSRLTVENAEVDWGGYLLRADGQARFADQKKPADPARYKKIQARAIQTADLLAGLVFSSPPEIRLHFNVPAGEPEKIELDATLFAGGLRQQGQVYDRIAGTAHLRNRELQIDSLQIARQNEGRLQVAGRYHLDSGIAELEVNNSLSFSDLLSLLPRDAAAGIAASGIRPFGAAEFSAVCGPCPLRQLPEQLRVKAHNLPVIYEDLTFDPLRFDLVRNGSRVEVKKILTQVNGHPMTAEGAKDLDSGAWQFSAQGRVPTTPIGELLGGKAQKWINRFEFNNRLPDISVEASRGAEKGTLQIRSTVSGRDVLCADVPFDTVDLTMTYSNRTFAPGSPRRENLFRNRAARF